MAADPLLARGLFVQIASFDGLNVTGVYFLYRDGKVVYVGQAVDIRRRVATHIGEGVKRFDAVSFIPCARDRLDALEREYILRLRPEYNRCAVARLEPGPAFKPYHELVYPIMDHPQESRAQKRSERAVFIREARRAQKAAGTA